MNERYYYLGFSIFSGIGPKRFNLLLQKFESAENAYNAQKEELSGVIGGSLSERFFEFKTKFSIEDYAKKLEDEKINFLTYIDDGYPNLLREIDSPPIVIFVKGSFNFDNKIYSENRFVGVVGSRRISSYGMDVTRVIVKDLVDAGCVVVSGLALGVDALSHKTTIDNNGKTIAVLGCGVDYCYPHSNQRIYDEILLRGGCILSEYPVGQKPTKGSFPSRNRLIAGLSKAVLVTEGSEDSGALITAEYAKKFRRAVFAVPGPITSSLSKGPNRLLDKGAKIATEAEDILKELNISFRRAEGEKIMSEDKNEQEIIELLRQSALTLDEISKKINKSINEVSVLISIMEIKDIIVLRENGEYAINYR